MSDGPTQDWILGPDQIPLADAPPHPDTELAMRACRVLRDALRCAGAQFTGMVDFGELNDVLLIAGQRGWLNDKS